MPYWRHFTTDPAGVAAAAMKTANARSWEQLDSEDRARRLRALLILSLQAATLSDASGPLGVLSEKTYGGDEERNAAGAAVARTAILLAPVGDVVLDKDIVTWDGAPPVGLGNVPIPGPIDVAALPALAVVAIACVAAAAACYVATTVTQAQHAIAFESEKTKRLLHAQATGIDVIGKHVEREKLAGRILSFDKEERGVLLGLENTQREIIREQRQPLPSPFDGARELGLALAEGTKAVGQSTADAISWALPVGMLVGAWALFKS